ncbi:MULTISPECIES: ATP-binding protein [Streptomyces]|uniref:ATP-binding protein n=1 Tax=Streptomyces TaxID=1883 RepID=UPI0035567696
MRCVAHGCVELGYGTAHVHRRDSPGPRTRWVIWIGAWDTDPEPPEPPRPLERVDELEEGRGLGLVMACADHWGWQPSARFGDRGKYIWCDLAVA